MKRPLPSSSYSSSSLTVEPPADTDSEEEEAMAYVGSKSKASTPVHPAQTMQSARTSAAVPAPKSLQRLVSSTHAANSVPFSIGSPEGGNKKVISDDKNSSASKRPRPAALAPPKVCLCAIHINQYFYYCEHFVFCLVVDVSTLMYGLHGTPCLVSVLYSLEVRLTAVPSLRRLECTDPTRSVRRMPVAVAVPVESTGGGRPLHRLPGSARVWVQISLFHQRGVAEEGERCRLLMRTYSTC
jgi:hypothetical protein